MPNESLLEEVKKKYGKDKSIAKEIREIKKEESDLRYLAELVLEAFKDKDLATKLYRAAQTELPSDFDKHLDLAFSVSNKLEDFEWASSLAKASAELASSVSDYVGLGQLVSNTDGINDKNWARGFYEIALSKATAGHEFSEVAVSAFNERYLNDSHLSATALQKAVANAIDVYHIASLANLVANSELPGGPSFVEEILSNATKRFTDPDDLEFLGRTMRDLNSQG